MRGLTYQSPSKNLEIRSDTSHRLLCRSEVDDLPLRLIGPCPSILLPIYCLTEAETVVSLRNAEDDDRGGLSDLRSERISPDPGPIFHCLIPHEQWQERVIAQQTADEGEVVERGWIASLGAHCHPAWTLPDLCVIRTYCISCAI